MQPTTKVSSNQFETTNNVLVLTAAATYYLKVVVKDVNELLLSKYEVLKRNKTLLRRKLEPSILTFWVCTNFIFF